LERTVEGPFTFETLSAQESLEKKSRGLTKIEPSFFRWANSYLGQLEAAYQKEYGQNPGSKRAAFLSDELRNAQNKAEELWKAREKKILQSAQVNARKDPLPPPPDHLTREESEFYHQLVQVLRSQWQRILPLRTRLERLGARAPPAASSPKPSPAPAEASPTPAPAAAGKDEVATIRALVDIPPFVGFDGKTYRIKKGEVLTIPKKFALILKERNHAALVG
jgi:DNA replication factor GINS